MVIKRLVKPKFWQYRGVVALALLPFSVLFYLLSKIRHSFQKPYRAKSKVICIGNPTIGGSGKTPLCLYLGSYFREKGIKAAFVSRGYGGSYDGCMRVDSSIHSASIVGDEAILLAAILPTYISRKRKDAVIAAEKDGAELIIMDDGLQNNSVIKDFTIITIDGGYMFGNGLLFPAGPLREGFSSACKKAQAIVLYGNGKIQEDLTTSLPVYHANLSLKTPLEGRYYAFAGIGRPEKFFDLLENSGVEVLGRRYFADHHNYTDYDLEQIIKESERLNAKPVTTAKDIVKIPEKYQVQIITAEVNINIDKSLIEQIYNSLML